MVLANWLNKALKTGLRPPPAPKQLAQRGNSERRLGIETQVVTSVVEQLGRRAAHWRAGFASGLVGS